MTEKRLAKKGMAAFLPDEVSGYRPEGADGAFTADTLFDLIDGGAEVYRSLNVRAVLDRTYAKEGAAKIIVDLFDMGSSEDAFGAYHFDLREKPGVEVGRESEYQGGSLFFWQDRYFVSVVALAESAQTKAAVVAIGKAISSRMPNAGEQPEIAALLPEQGLVKEQLFYFHDHMSFERRFLVGKGNPLRLGRQTEGLLARYRTGGGPEKKRDERSAVFLVVAYPSAKEAGLALQGLYSEYLKGAKIGDAARIENRRWAGSCREGARLFAVLDAPSKAEVERLLSSAAQKDKK